MTATGTTAAPRSTRLAAALAALAAAAALLLGTAAPAAAGEPEDIHSGLNQARAAAGLGALNRNASLDAVALGWANQMAANGAISHNPGVSGQIPAGWSAVGENVAQGQPTGSAMNSAWNNSPGHRANMLGGYSDVGIAFVSAGGTTWGVEVFALYGAVPAPVAAPRTGTHALDVVAASAVELTDRRTAAAASALDPAGAVTQRTIALSAAVLALAALAVLWGRRGRRLPS